MSKELLQQAIRLISASSAVIGCLPEDPGYNGSVLLIDDTEAARIEKDLDEAVSILEAITQPVEVQLVEMPDEDAYEIVADAEKWAHSKADIGIEIVRATQRYHGIKPASEGGAA